MNFTKRLLAFALVAIMLATSCVIVNAAPEDKATVTVGDTTVIEEGVTYTDLEIVSGQNGNKVTAVSMEFDPADGYIPMVFSGYSGTSGVLQTQYNIATQKYGYDVVGVINGAFFSMDSGTVSYGNYGTLVGMVISNGKIASTHAGYSDSVVAFGSDGSMNIVKSSIDFKLYIKGEEVKNGIYYVNKTSGSKVASNWNNNFYYYDTSCGRVCDTYAICPGYEVICEKIDNTDLSVGTTLKGKVLEVKENSYGAALAENSMDFSNKFVLFVKSSSPNAAYVKDLVEGDSINIGVTETVEESREIMENANSVISNVGWLVKDGVDRTRIDATIGTHSVTLEARWTAFGQKEDGSYVFFTSEGASTGSNGSITLRDVADYMISQGCVNVIRMDGGGSSAMYVKNTGNGQPGYAQASSRSVGDCILVVKKSSIKDEELEAALAAKIDVAKIALEDSPNADLEALIAEAEALLASESPVSGDVRRMIQVLSTALSGKAELEAAVAKADGINYKDYSEVILTQIRDAYDKAVALIGAEDATLEDIEAATAALNGMLALYGENELIISTGCDYTTTAPNRKDTYDDDQSRLTDGSKGNADAGNAKYSGWNNQNKPNANRVEIILDLGEAKETNLYRAYIAGGNWGITAADAIEAYISEDGEKFKQVASSTEQVIQTGDVSVADAWHTLTITAKADEVYNARYVKIVVISSKGNGFVWIDEVEAGLAVSPVQNDIYIHGFNTKIGAGDAFIFTSAMGEISSNSANLNWTGNILAKWDEAKGAYVVTEKFSGSGSTKTRTLADDEIIIAVHGDPSAPGSDVNKARLLSAKIGQLVEFYGIDVENHTTGIGAYVKIVDEAPKFKKGDVNMNGEIDAYDYAMIKRAYLGTATLTDEQFKLADINDNGKLDVTEYGMVKRHYLGTYNLYE